MCWNLFSESSSNSEGANSRTKSKLNGLPSASSNVITGDTREGLNSPIIREMHMEVYALRNFDDIISEFIPSSLLTFFGDLNDTDRSALLELTKNISRSRLTADTEKEFLEGLKVSFYRFSEQFTSSYPCISIYLSVNSLYRVI